jgi:hypothetical protein
MGNRTITVIYRTPTGDGGFYAFAQRVSVPGISKTGGVCRALGATNLEKISSSVPEWYTPAFGGGRFFDTSVYINPLGKNQPLEDGGVYEVQFRKREGKISPAASALFDGRDGRTPVALETLEIHENRVDPVSLRRTLRAERRRILDSGISVA